MKRLLALSALLSLSLVAKEILVSELNKKDGYYSCGEQMKLQITCKKDNQPVKNFKIKYKTFIEKKLQEEKEIASTPEGTVVLTATNTTPSWRYFEYYATEIEGAAIKAGDVKGAAGGMFDATKITHIQTYPADFKEFWANELQKLSKVPMKETLEKIDIQDARKDKIDLYTFSVTCAGISPATGYMAIPKNAKPKSHPLIIRFLSHCESDCNRNPTMNDAVRGALAFVVSWHGLPANQPKEYYPATLRKSEKYGNYTFRGAEKPELWWYKDMFLRDKRAIDYAKSRPEWDGKVIIFDGGSLAGAQVTFAAANTKETLFSICDVSAFCDIAGPVCGREAGFPWKYASVKEMADINSTFNKTGAYFDSCNFARHLNGEIYICCGFTDTMCPPSNIYAYYNAIPKRTPKFISTNPFTGHGGQTPNTKGAQRYAKFWKEYNAQKNKK